VPLITRTFTGPELIHLPFGLPENFSKMQLLEALNRYRIEEFAAASFRKHRLGNRIAHQFLPIEIMTSFTATPLKKPLLQSVPEPLKKQGAALFELVLEYTGVKPCANPLQTVRQILRTIKEYPVLADEIYFQLMKQTTNNRNSAFLLKTWELFLVVASIHPSSDERYITILAHLARATIDPDERISLIAGFIFIRFQTRHYLGTPYNIEANKHYVEHIPTHITEGTAVFGVLLYEVMWIQKKTYPRLPIPYVLHYMIELMHERRALRTQRIFRKWGNSGLVREILAAVNTDITALARGDVKVVSSLLMEWLKRLPNPLVPVEMLDEFCTMCEQAKFLGFVEKMPQTHMLTLIYLIGFLKDVAKAAEFTAVDQDALAAVFAPVIVRPGREIKGDEEKCAKIAQYALAFCTKLIQARDASIIYPLNPAYLSPDP
jgi:hypothetical protein